MFKIRGTNRLVLINKYKNLGWPEEKIKEHLNYLNDYFELKYVRLKKQNKSDSEIQSKFLEEFAKLIS